MKVKKKTPSYSIGGKVKKNKAKVTQKEGKTAEGDEKIGLFQDESMDKASPRDQSVEGKERTKGAKAVNAKIESVKSAYQSLSPEDKKGPKGKAMKEQLRVLRDSKRGSAAADSDVAINKRGEVYKVR
jgi:hypothetical protein